jgi:hypothetical protein
VYHPLSLARLDALLTGADESWRWRLTAIFVELACFPLTYQTPCYCPDSELSSQSLICPGLVLYALA